MIKTARLFHNLLEIQSLDKNTIETLFTKTKTYLTKNIAKNINDTFLNGKLIVNLFFEPSTRTRNSFEIAAKRLGGMVISPDMKHSATAKGESLIDTVHSFEALGTNIFIIRHSHNNTPHFVASEISTRASVINAGDGTNQHPTQALLDLYTISQHKKDFQNLTVSIIGDIAHSRVARSLIFGLRIMGTQQINIIAPKSLIPDDYEKWNVKVHTNFEDGLKDADVVVALRIQNERMQEADIPDPNKFFKEFGLTQERLAYAKKDAIVMHPGPINRGIEIESSVADGPQSVIIEQVRNGVAMRMAIMESICP